ncbi:MAG: DUF1646 family protein [Elusimicrobia bacterium]|nr:DUF1646 family protein [Elusimicrobiota bacterium]
MNDYFIIAGLSAIMALTLALPFSVKKVEEELEFFLCVMGALAVSISGVWSFGLVKAALKEPLAITAAVTAVGFIFRAVRPKIKFCLDWLTAKFGAPSSVFIVVTLLGLGSSVFTAIIAALVLAEIVTLFKFERSYEIKLVVYACYAIGLGAALTPIGEPLSTIVVAKLKAPPHNADFFYLIRILGGWAVPGVLLSAFMASLGAGSARTGAAGLSEDHVETDKNILLRSGKVYIFVMALILLGAGLSTLAERFIAVMPTWALFWANSVSAILDNATLAAAELTPAMTDRKVIFALMGLLISGGMLIPGNIPNIVSAAKLGIKSREWAKAAIPYGAALMVSYFVLLTIFVK